MNEHQAHPFALHWIEAWNTHDLDAILAHYTEDVVFHSPFVVKLGLHAEGIIRGKEELRSYFARGLAAYPELEFQLHEVLTGVGSLTLLYRSVNRLLAAETFLLQPDGKAYTVYCHYTETT